MSDLSSLIENQWQPIETAPYGKTVSVRNKIMDRPVLATRGYVHNGAVHPDQTFFTSVFTPDEFFPFPAGRLVCPDQWREVETSPRALQQKGSSNG